MGERRQGSAGGRVGEKGVAQRGSIRVLGAGQHRGEVVRSSLTPAREGIAWGWNEVGEELFMRPATCLGEGD